MDPQIELSNESFSISISIMAETLKDYIQCGKLTIIEISTDDFFWKVQIWLSKSSVEVAIQIEGSNNLTASIGEIGEILLSV